MIKRLIRLFHLSRVQKISLIHDVIKTRTGNMPVMYLCQKWNLPYTLIADIIYYDESEDTNGTT